MQQDAQIQYYQLNSVWNISDIASSSDSATDHYVISLESYQSDSESYHIVT
jgi:hypothetical protein